VTQHRGDHLGGLIALRTLLERTFCARECTLSSRLRLLTAVELPDADAGHRVTGCKWAREAGAPPLPSHIAAEHRINSLRRRADKDLSGNELAHGAAGRGAVDMLAALREWKNRFR
jgi:hydroxyacylglutathione hydrolase